MRLDEKARLVEAMLCAGGDANDVSMYEAGYHCNASHFRSAIDVTYNQFTAGSLRYGDRLTEAAYRLIESSPALRREWFGAR